MEFKTKPYKHQQECLDRFGGREYYALLAEMGTGKTWIIINDVAELWHEGVCDSLLVFAPNGVHLNWIKELEKHMQQDVLYQSAAWVANGKKAEREAIGIMYCKSKYEVNNRLRILTMNWESLQNKKGIEAAERFLLSSKKLMIVCDESDAAKNPSAKRTKQLLKLGKHENCVYRRIMTGTPVNNGPFDIFAQFKFLSEEILRTTSYWAFKSEYAEMIKGGPLFDHIKKISGRGVPQIVAKGAGGRPKYKNLDKLTALIAPHSFRVLKSDCLDLPDKIYKTIYFDITSEQKKVYKLMEDECRMLFEEDVTPVAKLTAIMKLAQITSGYYIHPLAKEPVRIDGKNPKLDLLIDRARSITDSNNQVIIWARYRIEIEDIVKRLGDAGIKCVEYHGGVKRKDRTEAIDAFESGKVPVFVGNQQAGGTGINLVAASYVIYFSNNFSLRDRLQSEDRAHRIGQINNVTYINIAAKKTVDEKVIDALMHKKNVADEIIDKGLKFL